MEKASLQRSLLGLCAIALLILGAVLGLWIEDADVGGVYLSGSMIKCGFVAGVAWLAWPQLMWLRRVPGGGVALAGLAVAALILVVRPRLLLHALPLVGAVAAVFIALGVAQRIWRPPTG